MQVWNVLLAARWKYRPHKIVISTPSHNFVGLLSSQLRHASTVGKNLLNSNTSSTRPDHIVNFGPLTAETCWRVWGTPANFNGFRVLAALLLASLVVGVSQTAALNRGCHLYSAGRPSRCPHSSYTSPESVTTALAYIGTGFTLRNGKPSAFLESEFAVVWNQES